MHFAHPHQLWYHTQYYRSRKARVFHKMASFKFLANTVLAYVISLKRTTLTANFKPLDLSTLAIFGDEFKL